MLAWELSPRTRRIRAVTHGGSAEHLAERAFHEMALLRAPSWCGNLHGLT